MNLTFLDIWMTGNMRASETVKNRFFDAQKPVFNDYLHRDVVFLVVSM